MIFGGIRKTSFIDYPGAVSCVLFTSGCNFRCPFCHNPELVSTIRTSGAIQDSEITAFLEERKGFLDGVVISGGEPTIQEDLVEYCRRIKAIGFKIKIDTNGSRPAILEEILGAGLADYVAMDIKTDPSQYASIVKDDTSSDDILASIRLIREASIPYEFRTTCVRPFIDERIMDRISRVISDAKRYALQKFVRNNILDETFFVNMSPGFDDAQMDGLRNIAAPRVQSCIIR